MGLSYRVALVELAGGIWRLQRDGSWQWDLLPERAEDLCRRGDSALLCREGGESLEEVCVAVVLARVGLRQSLAAGGEVGGEFRAVAAIGAPRGE